MSDPITTPLYRYATNRFPGDGVTVDFEINFAGGYLDRSHVAAFTTTNGGRTETYLGDTAIEFIADNQIRVSPAIPEGTTLIVRRLTPKANPLLDFVNGAILNQRNLNTTTKQAVFGAAEMVDRFADLLATFLFVNEDIINAVDTANEAIAIAENALLVANAADARSLTALENSLTALAESGSALAAAGRAATDADDAADSAEAAAASAADAVALIATANSNAATQIAAAVASASAAAASASAAAASASAAAASASAAASSAASAATSASNAATSASEATAKLDAFIGLKRTIKIDVSASDDGFITVGAEGYHIVQNDCYIEDMIITANTPGYFRMEVWKDTLANYPPTTEDNIIDTSLSSFQVVPEIELDSGVVRVLSSELVNENRFYGWKNILKAGDVLRCRVAASDGTIRNATVYFKIRQFIIDTTGIDLTDPPFTPGLDKPGALTNISYDRNATILGVDFRADSDGFGDGTSITELVYLTRSRSGSQTIFRNCNATFRILVDGRPSSLDHPDIEPGETYAVWVAARNNNFKQGPWSGPYIFVKNFGE